MQLLRRFTRFEISDAAIWKIAELMAYAMFVNLFLLAAEILKQACQLAVQEIVDGPLKAADPEGTLQAGAPSSPGTETSGTGA